MPNLASFFDMILGGSVTSLFLVVSYYVKQGLDARNGKIERRQEHQCRFNLDLDVMVKEMKNGLDDIFKRLIMFDGDVRSIATIMSNVREDVAMLKERTQWLQSGPLLEAENTRTGEKLVLFVENEPEHVISAVKTLELEGYKVHMVRSGPEAEASLVCYPYDFAIIDACLTEQDRDGLMLAQLIRLRYPSTKVIIFSGHALDTIPVGCQYVQKPYFSEVIRKMKGWV